MSAGTGLPSWQIFGAGVAEWPDGVFHARVLASVVISPQRVEDGLVVRRTQWRLVQAHGEGSSDEEALAQAKPKIEAESRRIIARLGRR